MTFIQLLLSVSLAIDKMTIQTTENAIFDQYLLCVRASTNPAKSAMEALSN